MTKCSRQKEEHVQSLEMGVCLACLRNGKENGDGIVRDVIREASWRGMTLEAMPKVISKDFGFHSV